MHVATLRLLEFSPSSDRIQKALDVAKSHLTNPLIVEELAEVAALSPRRFARAFRRDGADAPQGGRADWLEAARLMMDESATRWTISHGKAAS